MAIPCPIHQAAGWALYKHLHPNANLELAEKIARDCCGDCERSTPPSSKEKP